nr:40S ribosomal protein S16-like [Ipomoea batatas]
MGYMVRRSSNVSNSGMTYYGSNEVFIFVDKETYGNSCSDIPLPRTAKIVEITADKRTHIVAYLLDDYIVYCLKPIYALIFLKINGVPIELIQPEILRSGGGHTSQIYAIRQSIALSFAESNDTDDVNFVLSFPVVSYDVILEKRREKNPLEEENGAQSQRPEARIIVISQLSVVRLLAIMWVSLGFHMLSELLAKLRTIHFTNLAGVM